jgi:uncharacterized membrane-anchored protein
MNKRTLFFVAAVAVQLVILFAVPARQVFTRATGREVVLQVAPVDPYDVLKGYYVTLGYDISRTSSFPHPPTFAEDEVVYAIVEQQDDGPWQAVALERELPTDLPANRVAIRGRWHAWRILYGIEEFSIPESKRDVITDDLNKNRNEARVEVKVDANGQAALLRLKIQDRVYE